MIKRAISLVLLCLLALGGLAACAAPAAQGSDNQPTQGTGQTSATSSAGDTSGVTATTVLAEKTQPAIADTSETDSSSAVEITLNGTTIAADSPGVTVDGSTATITAAGSYRLSGTLDDGQIVVDSEDQAPVQLILAGVSITSATSAPIYIKQAGSAEIVLADGTENTLADAANYVYASADQDEPNAALFSDDDLTIFGGGSLTVVASYNDGIASKDGLTILGGTITVTAADDGIRGKDALIIRGGALTVTAGGDGLKSDNADDASRGYIAIEGGSFDITAGGDGMQAETDLVVTGGEGTIVAGGGSGAPVSEDVSAKGLKAAASITVDGGSFDISAADDGVHSDGDITVNGGALRIATGDDGIHADANVTVNGGSVTVTESYEGLEGASITLNSGAISLVSSDDGVNAAGGDGGAGPGWGGGPGRGGPGRAPMGGGNYTLTINGGTLVVDAGGDGIDANGTITMTDGLVIVHGPTISMNGALDYDSGFAISGGTLIAAGSARMAAGPDASSSQNAVLLFFRQMQEAGTLVRIEDSAGNGVLTFAPSKPYQSLAFSSPALATGETYRVLLGGSAAGSVSDGLYSDASYTPGAEEASFTISSVVTQIGGGRGRFRP